MIDWTGKDSFSSFNLNKMHEGIVIDNSSFMQTGKVKVYIPEMFIGQISDQVVVTKESIMANNIENSNVLRFNYLIERSNYIDCQPIMLNSFTVNSAKPNIGDTVMVQFINGDIKLPYYLNAHLLLDGEDILKSSNENPLENYVVTGFYRIIKLKEVPMQGEDVFKVGSKLLVLGYPLTKIDGEYEYNKQMSNCVKLFQKSHGITEDGEVGPITFRMLMSATKL